MRRDRFHRSHCPPAMWFFLLLFGVGTFFLIMDCDCDDGDPCTTNTCVGVCLTTRIDNCCQTNNDCTDTLCNQALCDTSRGRCVLQPYTNGVACDDQNVCTADDGCTGGFCVGTPLNCTATQCQTCACDPVSGCVYQDVVDGTSCRQDTCSVSTCSAGRCTGAPMDCTHLDDHCGLGQCVDGECVHVPGTDGTLCDDGLHCTSSDHCESGTCVGVQRQCFDTDPCTLNMCVEHAQSCVALPIQSKTCQTTCVIDRDCLEAFPWVVDIQCRDGSCLSISSDPSTVIRFLEYDWYQSDDCTGTRYKMAMFFMIETAVQTYDGKKYYRIAPDPDDVVGSFPLGFPGEVLDIQPSIYSGYSGSKRGQTTFTLHSECRDLSQECYQFTDRYYAFSVLLHDCFYNSGWQHCLDSTSLLNMYFNLSVTDCPLRTSMVQTIIEGHVIVDDEVSVVYPTRTLLNVSLGNPWMTDIRICVPKQGSLERCVLNTATQSCPNTGCFDWGSTETEALQDYWDLMVGGSPTAFAASSLLDFKTCRHHDDYDAVDKCTYTNIQYDWCNNTDGFSATFYMLEPYDDREVVIDVKYDAKICGRRLQSGPSTKREMSVITVV